MTSSFESGSQFRKDVEALAPRIFFEGKPAIEPDALLIAEDLVLREALIIDLFDDVGSAVAYRRALLSLQTIDAKSVFCDFKACYACLVAEDFLNEGNWQTFKQSVSTYPTWIVAPLLRSLSSDEVTVNDFSKALQWFRFDSHLSFRGTSRYPEALAYLDDEFTMRKEPLDIPLLKYLNSILREWTSDFPDEAVQFMGHHGSGATREVPRRVSSPRRKTRSLAIDPQVRKYIDFRTKWDVDPFQLLKLEGTDLELEPMELLETEELPIKVEFVPKDPTQRRVVSPEGTMRMFLQGDASQVITPWMNSFHWCDLHDQRLSQKLCIVGSRDGGYTTVDASKASDFVRHSHLQVILEGTPLLPYYLYTRARYAEVPSLNPKSEELSSDIDKRNPDMDIICLEKACPMGSRICFLMETLVFALCCEAAVRLTSGRASRRGDFRVYGDDTIIRSRFYARLRIIFAMMRFRINDTKTFSEHGKLCFREACGMYAVNGVDVTPVLISRKYQGLFWTLAHTERRKDLGNMIVPEAAQTMGLIDFTNRLMLRGLVTVRRWVYSILRGEEWMKHIFRVSLSDYQKNVMAWRRGDHTQYDYPSPTAITFDHVDVNFNLRQRVGSYRGKPTWIYKTHGILTVHTSSKGVPQCLTALDYFHWSSTRSKTEVGGRSVPNLWDVERLTYCSPGTPVWRFLR